MGVVMKQFIDRFKAMEKIANETLAANPEALVGVDSLPGSEHDAAVPEEAKKPDGEVSQGQPAGATSASGAVNGGDAKPLNEGKLEMDQALLNPEKKPLITDDALTAKVANAHLASLVNDLLSDINAKTQKQASAAKDAAAPVNNGEKTATAKKEDAVQKIRLDDETITKIAAASAAFNMGRSAAQEAVKNASAKNKLSSADARALVKDACVKAAQADGLDPAAAEAAAENAMAAAGMAPAETAAVADAGAAAADAGEAAADAGAADSAAAAIPDDVTEEELATAIVDLVSSGELDPDTAKALVEEIAGDEGVAAPSEDEAAKIIAQGIESGEITPEQAQEIAAAVESGASNDASAAADAGAAAADAGAADAEAQGAAAAEQAAQDAVDEAKGAADAEQAIKDAAEHIRATALSKVASAIVAKRNEKSAAAVPGGKILAKVASILKTRQAQKQAAATPTDDDKYIAGFKKKAEELGVDPAALARYACENAKQAK